MVRRAGEAASADSCQSLAELLGRYLPALRAHLIERRRIDGHEADDLLQSFVAAKFLEQNLAAQADPTRGKFRTLVLTALDRFVVDRARRKSAKKRGPEHAGGSQELLADQAAEAGCPADAFDVAWARQVLTNSIERMKAECRSSERLDLWEIFEQRILHPTLTSTPPLEYEQLVSRFGLKSPREASNLLITAKRMFERSLRTTIAEYAATPGEIDEEIRDLRNILARHGAAAE